VRLVPFEVAHGEALLAADLNDDRNRPAPEFGNFMPTLVHEGMAFTGIDNGHLVGAAGIFPLWEGVGEAWFWVPAASASTSSAWRALSARGCCA